MWLGHKGLLLPAAVTNTTSNDVSFSSDYGNVSWGLIISFSLSSACKVCVGDTGTYSVLL